ncbi:MAG: FAD:protein FMN transferase [Saprospiraceae bacterium]|nr:FAD:protein FMN transferase [Saprospiraceae bacterium]
MGNLVKIVGLFTAFSSCLHLSLCQPLIKFAMERPALGSVASITCFGLDSMQMQQAAERAFYLLDSFDLIFSDYKQNSETMLLAEQPAKRWIPISPPLYDLIEMSQKISAKTDNRFTVKIGALTKLWRQSLAQNRIPPKSLIRRARKTVTRGMLQLADDTLLLKKNINGLRMDFGGIAKGYIADHMGKTMTEQGVPIFLINLGGDLLAGEAPPDQSGWKIDVSWCDKVIEINHAAIATSGPDFQFFVHKGVRYAHIIDPVTGWGVKNLFATTVIASTGWQADAFASAFTILPLDRSRAIIDEKIGLEAIIAVENELFQSQNFSHYIVN